jgi:SAM-dependent methyltransferase
MSTILDILGRPPVHPFPARMAPSLALNALSALRRGSVVVDPMAGSGTVIALARAQGHRAIGFDVDPLAVLMARVWTRTVDPEELRECSVRVLAHAQWIFADITLREAYPIGADEETKQFVRYWFDGRVRRQLAAMSSAINEVDSDLIREALWCAFSRQIIAKQAGVSRALDLSHSRPHRVFSRAPREPFDMFREAVERVIDGCVTRNGTPRGPSASIRVADARRMPVADETADLVFTSPPYLNAIDYLRCSKFSLVWMGYPIKELRITRQTSVGAEVGAGASAQDETLVKQLRLKRQLPSRMNGILHRYIQDMELAINEVRRILRPGGRAVYVVGENTIRGTYIPTGNLLKLIGLRARLKLVSRTTRVLPANRRYLPPPGTRGGALDGRMRREVVLTFENPVPSSLRRP